MKYKLLRFSLLSMLVMFFGGNVFAETLTVDFEDETTAYTNWVFTNFTTKQTNSSVAAHGGSYFGTTGGKASGALTTKDKIAYPKSIQFFVSKTSTNTTASSWSVQVSSDGEEWTTVGDSQSAGANITKGTWTEVNRELKSYSNVYVRIAYEGSTAIRTIDDVTLTYSTTASTKTATTVTLSEGYATSGVVGGTIDLPSATVKAGDATLNATVTWTSSNEDVATIRDSKIILIKAGTTTIKASYAGDDTNEASYDSYTLTVEAAPYMSIAAMLKDITSTKTNVTYQFENLLVTYVNGSNTYVSDGRNGFLLYGSNLGLVAGNAYNGSVSGQLYTYNGLPEMAVNADGITTTIASEGNNISWTTIAPADLPNNINVPVTIENAVYVSAGSGKNLNFKVGDTDLVVYNNWSIGVTALEADKTYTLTGVGSVYSKGETTTYQLYLVSFEEKAAEEPAGWVDIKANLTSTDLIPEGAAQWDDVSTGIAVAANGTLSRVAKDADNAVAVLNGKWHGAQYGWANFSATVKVEGCVKITLGQNNYGKEAIVKNSNGDIVAKIDNMVAGKVWSASNPNELISVGYYRTNEPTTLTVEYGSYLGYFAVEAIDPADIPEEVKEYIVTFNKGDAEGVAPVAQKVEIGSKVKVPANTTLFIEGKTLTAWTDGTNRYKAGDEVTVNADMTLTPVFTDNTVAFADRTAETTLTWQFGESNGAGTLNAQGKKTILVTQATIGEAVIDVKMDIDATSGKINNVGRSDEWAQCNDGTILTIPAYKGTAVSFKSYSEGTGTTIGGVEATNKTATYEGTAETLDIVAKGMGYISNVTAVYPVPSGEEPVKVDVNVSYSIDDIECEGNILPAGGTYAAGDEYTIPAHNFTLFMEGYTLTGWSDGTNVYAAGEKITLPNEDLVLAPVFTKNEVNLADRQNAVHLEWPFGEKSGAGTINYEGNKGFIVCQTTVNGKMIDVKLEIDATSGKFNNVGRGDIWAQVNAGTKLTVPSCKDALISMDAYNDITTTTIDGQSDYTSGKHIDYKVASSAETVDIVIGDGAYYSYLKVDLPVVEQQGGKTYTNEAAKVVWAFSDPSNINANTTTPNGVFSTVAANTGDLTLTGSGTGQAKYPDGTSVTFAKLKPAGSTNSVEWSVKPASGLTFTPTKISAYIARFGTDAENGITISAKVGEGEAITLGNFTAPRNNKAQADDKFGSNSNYTNQFVIELTAEQQATLASSDGLSVFGTVGVGNTKEGGYAEVTIEGLINGTIADVEKYTLTTVTSPAEGGSINVYPVSEQYEAGTEVTLTATENFGYDFVNWTNAAGDEVSTEAKFKYTMTADETLTANFRAVETYELALTIDGTNDYMVTVNPAPTVVDGKNMYEAGTAVQLTANQYDGLVTFTNWSDGDTNSSKLIRIENRTEITAVYTQADIIAGWDFYKAGGNGRKADFAAADNDADALSLVNTETGETQGWLDKSTEAAGGYESFKGAAVNWRTGSSNGDVGNWHWQTKVNAEAFTNITVQFQMLYNYNAYQRYNAEFSTDGENWTNFGSITMEGAKNPASFNETLPEAANNQKDLFIRMIADKTSNVDGSASANDGNALAMFFITGTQKLVDDPVAPALVSSVPADGATGASASGKIVLNFDKKVQVVEGAVATLGTMELTPTVSGKVITFEYKGLEYSKEYTFTLPANTVQNLTGATLADAIAINFTTMERPTIEKGLYDEVVSTAEELAAAIKAANERADKTTRYRIFIKKGTYALPSGANKHYTHTNSSTGEVYFNQDRPDPITYVTGGKISFIGEDRDATIITQAAANETFAGQFGTTSIYDGIGNSDVLQLSGDDYYFQDLTIKSGIEDARGRNLAVQDKSKKSIYKNVCLYGYQDTWTSNNDNGLYYFEGGIIRGRTDYICGKGDAYFDQVEFRQIAGGYCAVPSKPANIGWVMKDCVINGDGSGVDGNYTLGRPWGSGTPVAVWIDTKMNVVPSAIGWNEMGTGWPKRFAEYNSTTSTGSVIDLSGRKKTFGDGHVNNPVLTAEEALEYSDKDKMFGDWNPQLMTESAPMVTDVKLVGTILSWTGNSYSLLYAICKNGEIIAYTKDTTFDLSTLSSEEAGSRRNGEESVVYSVRAANEMGGLGEAAEAVVATGIEEIAPATTTADGKVYNLQGIRVDKAQKGLYIINGRKVVIK